MPVDTSMVDARAFYSQYVNIISKKWVKNRTTGELEMYGSCPWCPASVDSFMFTDMGRYTHKIRGGCGRYGSSPYWFLRDYEGLNHWEACERLDIDPGSEYVTPARKRFDDQSVAPCKAWQEQAAAYIHMAQKRLWSSRGKEALAYLRSRGLEDDIIRNAQLGYIPFNKDGRWFKDSLEQWGLSVDGVDGVEESNNHIWIPEGILIPWYSNDEIWKLCIRRLHGLKEDDNRYFDITGSSDMLYNFDAIEPGKPVVLVEGPFDALIGNQECRDAVFVATGSTGKGRRDYLIKRLLLASSILVAFDDDELKNGRRAGDTAAKRWLELIPSATHWLPWKHDINDMLKAGDDLREWLALGIAANELINYHQDTSSQPVTPDSNQDALSIADLDCCSVCGVPLNTVYRAAYSEEGKPYCNYYEDTKEAYCSKASILSMVKAVDTIFGPCQIGEIEPLQEQKQLPEPKREYSPSAIMLKGRCPAEEVQYVVRSKGNTAKRIPCKGEPLENGWCQKHQGSLEVLQVGAHIKYPRLQINPHLYVGQGKMHWEGLAAIATSVNLEKWSKAACLMVQKLKI